MNKTLALAVSLWLASPAAAQVNLKITGSINGSTKASDYSGPAPTGPGMVFFNGFDVWPYINQAPPPPPPSLGTALMLTGSINGVTDGSNYKSPAPAAPGMVFVNGHDVWSYMHQTIAAPSPTPTPMPTSAATPAPTSPNTITPPQPVAPQPSAAPPAAPITASTTTSVKTIAPAAAEARKKKFERLSRKLDALADKLAASKLDAAKKSALSARIKTLSAQLKDPAGKLTPEAAEEAVAKLHDDFAAAEASKP